MSARAARLAELLTLDKSVLAGGMIASTSTMLSQDLQDAHYAHYALQEAADAAAKVRAAEIQERPAVRARSSSPEDAAGTTGRAGTASVEDDAAPGTASFASRNGGSEGPCSDDGSNSGEDATLSTGASSGDVTSEEEEPAAPSPAQASRKQVQALQPVERQGSTGPIRGHVEYLQVSFRNLELYNLLL
jgi:hypothetical protein